MVPISTVTIIAGVAFVFGLIATKLYEFFWFVEVPDERDDIIEKLQTGLGQVQDKLQKVVDQSREIKVKWVDSERNNIDLQIKYEESLIENQRLKDEKEKS